MKKDKSKDIKMLIEKIGVFSEKSGFPPAMGRIFGYLMVSDPPHKTFEEIQQYLQISKSAVSNALKFLMMKEIVDYITFPSDRKRYFRLNISGWSLQLKKKMEGQELFQEIIQEALAARSNKYPEFNQNLSEILEFHSFIQREIKSAIQKWEKQKKK